MLQLLHVVVAPQSEPPQLAQWVMQADSDITAAVSTRMMMVMVGMRVGLKMTSPSPLQLRIVPVT